MGSRSEIPIVQRLYDFYKLFHTILIKFPKAERYSLGQIIQQHTLELIEQVYLAGGSENPAKSNLLRQAAAKLDLLKLLIRLANAIDALRDSHYLQLQSELQEIGKMLGGWIRYTKQ